jgi:hypothetical protein
MDVTTRLRTPLPPRPPAASVAVDSTHQLLEALVEGDLLGVEALLSPSACVWWPRSGGFASVEGAQALARALVELLAHEPPTRLSVVGSSPRTTVTSAYVDDAIAWSLEVRLEDDRIVGGLLRGKQLLAH